MVAFHDFLANGQSQAVARVFGARVQTLEEPENPVKIPGFDADALIGHREHPMISVTPRSGLHDRWTVAAEFDRVAYQVLEYL